MKNLWGEYLKPTPKNVTKALLAVKAFLGSGAVAALLANQPKAAAIIALVAGLINEVANYLISDKNENNNNNNTDANG